MTLLAQLTASRRPCALVTVVRCDPPTSARPGDKAIVTSDGRLRGWVGGSCAEPVVRREALRALSHGSPCLVRIRPEGGVAGEESFGGGGPSELITASSCPSGGSLDVFIEPQLPKPQLLVFGDSPAAHALAKLGELTGFRAKTVTHAGLANLSVPASDAWAVVATMGHYDEDAAEAALAHPDLDVSLIASTRRAAAVRAELLARGLDERMVERLRTPAGKVRGVTQEQIALLALAEVVTARQKRGPKQPAQEAPHVVFATDPVCGMTVDPLTASHKADFGGTTFWFCSAGCQAEFEKTPERYLRPIEA